MFRWNYLPSGLRFAPLILCLSVLVLSSECSFRWQTGHQLLPSLMSPAVCSKNVSSYQKQNDRKTVSLELMRKLSHLNDMPMWKQSIKFCFVILFFLIIDISACRISGEPSWETSCSCSTPRSTREHENLSVAID